ncbi:dephospho-CoA kinase [Clostridiaceae bacterium 35-E11]
MKIIGLTGGIASGKSTVSGMLRELEIPVIDADKIAREIVAVGKPALKEIEVAFGKDVIHQDGSLNREQLGKIVFSDKEKLKNLNEITHRRIIKEILNRIEMYREKSIDPVIIIDAALLIETGIKDLVDEIWVVLTDENTQLKRLMERDKMSAEEGLKRIRSQMTVEEKKKYADEIIDNNHDLKHLKRQVTSKLSKVNCHLSEG